MIAPKRALIWAIMNLERHEYRKKSNRDVLTDRDRPLGGHGLKGQTLRQYAHVLGHCKQNV